MQTIPGIEVIIWDFDRTLYQNTPQIQARNRAGFYSCIAEQKGISREEAKPIFEEAYARLQSLTRVAEFLGIPGDVMNSALDREDIADLLNYDERLVQMFQEMQFRHVQVTRSQRTRWQRLLGRIGVPESAFEFALCYEETTSDKSEAFRYIAERTGLAREKLVVVEDRKDIITRARAEGMKTIYVWGECADADVSVPTVYDVQGVLQR